MMAHPAREKSQKVASATTAAYHAPMRSPRQQRQDARELREAREDRGMTQAQAAAAVGVSVRSWRRWEATGTQPGHAWIWVVALEMAR